MVEGAYSVGKRQGFGNRRYSLRESLSLSDSPTPYYN